jgi:hypothetical protein
MRTLPKLYDVWFPNGQIGSEVAELLALCDRGRFRIPSGLPLADAAREIRAALRAMNGRYPQFPRSANGWRDQALSLLKRLGMCDPVATPELPATCVIITEYWKGAVRMRMRFAEAVLGELVVPPVVVSTEELVEYILGLDEVKHGAIFLYSVVFVLHQPFAPLAMLAIERELAQLQRPVCHDFIVMPSMSDDGKRSGEAILLDKALPEVCNFIVQADGFQC